MNDHLYALIMAGGGGTRLWPLSRQQHPKQMLMLFGERTMFQLVVDRLLPLLPPERILVVTGADQVAPLAEQVTLPPENFIVEPLGRNTAACIGLAALHLRRRDPEAVMAVLTADHYIRRTDVFRTALTAARAVAEQGYLVTLGIEPTFPATGYGYICRGAALAMGGDFPVFRVQRFAEKPDEATAIAFLAAGTYAWNSGMFIWRAARVLEEIDRWMPPLSATLHQLDAALDRGDYAAMVAELWSALPRISIDYGVMEHAEQVAVIPVDLGWSDVGSWDAVQALRDADAAGNVAVGAHLAHATTNTMVFAHGLRLVATIGVHDLIVVDTPDALLITTREQAQDVREVVERLRAEGRTDLL